MKLNFLCLPILSGVLALVSSGCVGTVDGHRKAGVPFVKDKIESFYERPVPQIIVAAKAVLSRVGQLQADNTIENTLHARVDTRNVWVRVEPGEKNVSHVIVQARTRSGGSDIELASEIDKQIALQLASRR